MASHDTELRKLRAASQDNTVHIQKLNEALRKLKDQIDRQNSDKRGRKRHQSPRK